MKSILLLSLVLATPAAYASKCTAYLTYGGELKKVEMTPDHEGTFELESKELEVFIRAIPKKAGEGTFYMIIDSKLNTASLTQGGITLSGLSYAYYIRNWKSAPGQREEVEVACQN